VAAGTQAAVAAAAATSGPLRSPPSERPGLSWAEATPHPSGCWARPRRRDAGPLYFATRACTWGRGGEKKKKDTAVEASCRPHASGSGARSFDADIWGVGHGGDVGRADRYAGG
jgi:hypothetical protein